jgi:hypothetical protein
MSLLDSELKDFLSIYLDLLWRINKQYDFVQSLPKPTDEFISKKGIIPYFPVMDAMWNNPTSIDHDLLTHTDAITDEEHSIITAWRKNFIKDKFYVIEHLPQYTVMIPLKSDSLTFYGVHGIAAHLQDTIHTPLPYVLETVLLPFQDKIIYDGFYYLHKDSTILSGNKLIENLDLATYRKEYQIILKLL